MKTKLITLILALTAGSAFGHGEIKIGPNGGRVVELSKDGSTLGEVSEKDGKFQIEILDGKMKSVPLADQELTVTSGDRDNPEKLPVEKKDEKYFVAPTAKSGQWVILQYKANSKAKPVTARFHYDTKVGDDGKTPNWLYVH